MGIHFMEAFDINETTDAAIKAALTLKGIPYVATATAFALAAVTEEGVSRQALGESAALSIKFNYLKIPIPASKVFYASFRVRWVPATLSDGALRLYITHQATIASMNAANSYAFAMPVSGKWNLYNGWTGGSEPSYSFAYGEWVTIEIYRGSDGSLKVWVNDFLLYQPSRNIPTANIPENYVYIGRGQASGSTGGAAFVGWQFSDVIVIDPSTPGLQYRPGKTGRVLTAPYAADVIAEWTPDPSVSKPHNQIMATFKGAPAAADLLTTATLGAREQYSLGTFPSTLGDIIHGLKFEPVSMNLGASVHSFAVEYDRGGGITEVKAQNVTPGGALASIPVFSDRKGDGTAWTPQDLVGLKVGFSVKS